MNLQSIKHEDNIAWGKCVLSYS